MQCFHLNKEIKFDDKIEDLLLISIDDELETIDDKDGIRVTGKIIISGNAKTEVNNKEFFDNLDIDLFLTYEEIEERNSLKVLVNDFNYTINEHILNLNIVLKVDGLKEIENTFLAEEDIELFEEEIEIEDDKRVYTSEEVTIQEGIEETSENTICVTNEIETPKMSLLKAVFSNKRIKEEVSWKLHCVKGETSYEQIAAKYSVNLNKLISINKNEKLEEGKLIFLPLE